MRTSFLTLMSVALLSACGTNTLPPVNAIPASRMDAVLGEIKRQVSVYQARIQEYKAHPERDEALVAAKKKGFKCGDGQIDFGISAVTMTLSTTQTDTAGGSIGFSVPLNPGSAALSFSGSRKVNNTQELSIPLYPGPVKDGFRYSNEGPEAPIAEALFALRASLLLASTYNGACLYTYNFADEKSDKGGTYKLGLEITSVVGGGVDIKLAPIVAGASGESKSVTGNSLTVSFGQVLPKLKPGEKRDPKVGEWMVTF